MNALSQFAEDQGIKVLVEPEPGLLLENSQDFLSFIKSIESEYIRLNFDIAFLLRKGRPSRSGP